MISDSLLQNPCDRQFLWVSTNPSLQCFHRRLLSLLNREFPMTCWDYSQTPDEPSNLDAAMHLLHQYVSASSQPLHLVGHGQGGVLALSYARRYPRQVASVVLLSVAAQPVITWQTYYYEQLHHLACNRQQVLKVVASRISKLPCPHYIYHLAERLDRDLLESPAANSLLQRDGLLQQGEIAPPLLVCGAGDDPVMAGNIFGDWSHYLKLGDRLWTQPEGGHFFHYQYAEAIGQKVSNFWRSLPEYAIPCLSNISL
jgi:pimeloyl-ACP methyl ester carboxylesterase